MKILRSLVAALLLMAVLTTSASAGIAGVRGVAGVRRLPVITGSGHCGIRPFQTTSAYYFIIGVHHDPKGRTVDETVWDATFQDDRSAFNIPLSTPYDPIDGAYFYAIENLGPSVWVRWHSRPWEVYRIVSSTLCPGDTYEH